MVSQIMMMGFLAVSTFLAIATLRRMPDRQCALKEAAARRRGP